MKIKGKVTKTRAFEITIVENGKEKILPFQIVSIQTAPTRKKESSQIELVNMNPYALDEGDYDEFFYEPEEGGVSYSKIAVLAGGTLIGKDHLKKVNGILKNEKDMKTITGTIIKKEPFHFQIFEKVTPEELLPFQKLTKEEIDAFKKGKRTFSFFTLTEENPFVLTLKKELKEKEGEKMLPIEITDISVLLEGMIKGTLLLKKVEKSFEVITLSKNITLASKISGKQKGDRVTCEYIGLEGKGVSHTTIAKTFFDCDLLQEDGMRFVTGLVTKITSPIKEKV